MEKLTNNTIGVISVGIVGSHAIKWFKDNNYKVFFYDKFRDSVDVINEKMIIDQGLEDKLRNYWLENHNI